MALFLLLKQFHNWFKTKIKNHYKIQISIHSFIFLLFNIDFHLDLK